MKALKLLAIATLVLLETVIAHSTYGEEQNNSNVQAQIFAHGKDMIFVQLENPEDNKLSITIVDQDGVVLYRERIKKSLKVLKRFDLSKLPAGTYSCEILGDSFTQSKKIYKE